ncbi:YfiR family protein [Novosphingobium sp.]|uniref:YfiR family protein n=1 Tax=Novosphingobium sp. TaxID=1874826 RepID=UPI0027347535|nr:YfiR family protein [Novosphingobium sp.]MDP3906112.1 YfiR family protein [Novosphingobium sp.]
MKVANRLRIALLALAAVPLVGAADLVLVPVAGGANDPYAAPVGRIVQSITEYTSWPTRQNPVTLCVVGPAAHAERLDDLRLADGRLIERRTVALTGFAPAACDALYIGRVAMPDMRILTAQARGRGVLTIAEADPDCRSQAMFCLLFPPQAVTFRMNIDAIARSGLKVDPRVLRISQGGR